ncbi:MAG: InlB B-repeat-containing protein [Candidatus Saccharibacteria bacterium]|nr:InlB B-repeat-containing protein [Candidatus Saccharibacteria bacterium]
MQKWQSVSLGKHDYSSWLSSTRVLFFVFLVSIFSIFVNKNSVYADAYSASLSGAGSVNIDLAGASGIGTASSTITANTTCPNGYIISVNGINDNETGDFNLYLDGDDSETTNKFTTSSGTLSTPAMLSADTWGILVNNDLYSGVSSTPVAWFNVGVGDYTPGVNNTHTLTYGASYDGSMLAGTYSMADNGRIVYTLEMDNTCVNYTVAFDANEPSGAPTATGTMENQSITKGVPTPLTANTFEVTGYAFTGWNTAADGSGASYADGASVTNLTAVNTTITLYAQWSQNIIQNYARCPYLGVGDTELLTDIRDGKTYWIAKMADGHCWMTQNLDLDIETTPNKVAALTSENTDLNVYNANGYTDALGYSQDSTTNVITWTPERATLTAEEMVASNWAASNSYTTNYSLDPGDYYYTDTFQTSLNSPAINLLDDDHSSALWQSFFSTTPFAGNGVHGHVGNYYTWSAAVASNDTSSYRSSTLANIANNPQNSICPAGWRLPLTTTASPNYTNEGSYDEVKRLNFVLNNNQNITNSSAKLEAAPFYMTRAGYVDASEATGPMTRGGRGSGIWTSAANSSSEAETLYESSTSVNAPSNSKRNLGYPVRCISRDEAVVYRTITFQANEPAGAGTATGTMAPMSIAAGASDTLRPNTFMLPGYTFTGWNTSANGTGTSYANGASITPNADVTLYAQWNMVYAVTYNYGTEVFDGSSYIDTKTKLFDTGLINKDFMLSFTISNVTNVSGQSNNLNNFATAMQESNPYPGFVIRRSTSDKNDTYKIIANATGSIKYDPGTQFAVTSGVQLRRGSGLLYFNNATTNPVLDYNNLAGTFDSPLVFGAGLSGSNVPWRYSNATLTDIILTINYAYNDTVTLPTPTKTNDTFLYWDTVADGSGAHYSGGATVTLSRSLTLYPIWQSTAPGATHTVTFLANAPAGAPTPTGTMANQTVADNVATNLTPNGFAISGYEFNGWNTAANGSSTRYADGASVTLAADLILYAQWTQVLQHYVNYDFGDESFDGSGYIDTKIKLFSSELISNDFTLSFGMANPTFLTGQDGNFNNVANSMDESGSPWPGFVVRFNSDNINKNNTYNINGNVTTAQSDKLNANPGLSVGLKLERTSGYLYLNDNHTTAVLNFNNLANTFDTPLTFGAGLKNGQPFRYSDVDVSDILLKIKYNHGTTVTLPTPTKTNDTFLHWNTAADNTGASYNGGDTVTVNDDITLYPVWLSDVPVTTHTVTFLANAPTGAPTPTGTMANQSIVENIATNLNPNAYVINGYTFDGWNTEANGSGTRYADEASVTLTADMTLYARWTQVTQHDLTYVFGNESFDGTNSLDTNIKLFSSALNSKDFDLSLNMGTATYVTNSDNINNIVTAMSEAGQPYPGFVVRYGSSANPVTKYNFVANASTTNSDKYTLNNINNTDGFRLRRVNGAMYLNSNETSVVDFNHLANTFDSPLVFGAGLSGSNQLFRNSKIDLTNIRLTITFDSIDTVTLPTPVKPLYVLSEWNTAADGSGASYPAGSIFTPSANLTLYPIWDPIVPVVNEYHEINLEKTRGTSTATIDLTGMDMGSSVQFKSSDTSIATVDSNGVVTAINPGEATITVLGAKRAYYNVYVSESGIPLFNITPDPIQIYYNSRDAWDATKTKASFLANMRETFEKSGCKIYNYRDNNGYLDSAVAYGWTDGSNYCDQSRAYDTGQTGALNVYLYDTTNQQKTGNALSYTGATNGLIYNMIPGKTYYWELADDPTTYGLVKATGKHRILNFTQGDNSRVSGSQITRNTREIGGLPVDTDYNGTIDGYTNYGRIFRAERLWTANGANADKFTNLGANFEIDVRSPGEGSSDSRLAGYRNDTVVQYAVKQGVDTSNYDTLRAVVTRAMQNVINGDNIYLHCSYGSDRTGTLAWVLEGLLGVTDEARLGDYELSTFYGAVDRNRYFEYEGSNTKRFTYMMTFLETGQNVYDWYMYGSIDKTADAALINNFRTAMITYESEG